MIKLMLRDKVDKVDKVTKDIPEVPLEKPGERDVLDTQSYLAMKRIM